jgi:HAD superfamily hydrolase (TIGR01549 family)
MIKNIIFDFDGVILNSVPTKTEAFRKLFETFSREEVQKLLDYHIENGGVSRYLKIKYFFEKILHQVISEEEIQSYAHRYSELTKEELINPKYLIEDAVNFIQQNSQKYNMHIASGADEQDLQYICKKLDLRKYFLSISGSPIKKADIVSKILSDNKYIQQETILIGDSINDHEAAHLNGIKFYGYNNERLEYKFDYIKTFRELSLEKTL